MKTIIDLKKHTGFTLIEVIIAMTLLSLILVLLFSTIFTANKSWQSTERKIAHNDETRIVAQFIQRQVTQMTPLLWFDNKKRKLIFSGKNNEISFTTTLPAHRGGGGVQLVTLKINNTDDMNHLDLYYSHASGDVFPIENDNFEQVTLLEDIEDIEFAYFGREKADQTPQWQDEWQNDQFLPLLISIKIQGTEKNQDWPELKIPFHSHFVGGQPQFVLRKTSQSPI